MAQNILQQIVADKYQNLARLKREYPIKGGRQRRRTSVTALLQTLQERPIIAEVKRASPSRGHIDMACDHVQKAQDYAASGAGMVSVLTDEPHFCGSFAFLQDIGRAVDCPLLCKDFIIDEWQVDAADFAGADAVLLIVACFAQAPERLAQLYNYALSKGLIPLVELYDSQERYDAYSLQPYLLGVNSRDLTSMTIDLQRGARTLSLLRRELSMPQSRAVRASSAVPELPLFIGESGISKTEDAQIWARGGADCLLIGTSLMQPHCESLDHRIAEFSRALKK